MVKQALGQALELDFQQKKKSRSKTIMTFTFLTVTFDREYIKKQGENINKYIALFNITVYFFSLSRSYIA